VHGRRIVGGSGAVREPLDDPRSSTRHRSPVSVAVAAVAASGRVSIMELLLVVVLVHP